MRSRVHRQHADAQRASTPRPLTRVDVVLRTVCVVAVLTPCCEYARGRLWTLTVAQYMAITIKHLILCVVLNLLLRVDDLPPHMRVLGAFDHGLLAVTRLRHEWWKIGFLMMASAYVALRFHI